MKKFYNFALVSLTFIAFFAATCDKTTETTTDETAVVEETTTVTTETTTTETTTNVQETEKWTAPAEADAIENPLESNEDNIAAGLLVYKRNCKSCHGKLGAGDGVGSADCSVPPANFTLASFGEQSDGAVYWKLTIGKGDMKGYKDEFDEDELWQVIVYIKSLSAKE